eukprot:TRINITY_DN3064_c0_g1_i2.p1 TRINITY_DN3064_c0_g1~~TRINITY_DN3064_c0_g1_i2.p1  ORF type:complete len:154 (-),score=27.28 TRINITY_DN3064_c0_g1_i2:217-678(-)
MGGTLYREKSWKGKTWLDNFQHMCSKDNDHYPANFREYFDTPRAYDVNGSRRKMRLLPGIERLMRSSLGTSRNHLNAQKKSGNNDADHANHNENEGNKQKKLEVYKKKCVTMKAEAKVIISFNFLESQLENSRLEEEYRFFSSRKEKRTRLGR